MKKVLLFSLAYLPTFTSGAEAAIEEITDRIDPLDIEFHMVTLSFSRDLPCTERVGNVFVHRVGFGNAGTAAAAARPIFYISKMLFPLLAAYKARRLHAVHRFDAMWAMMTYMLFPTVIAYSLGVRVPYVLTLQDGDSYERVFGRWFMRPLVPILDYGFRHAKVIQVISRYLATWPPRRGSRAPVIIVRNGANPRDLEPVDAPRVAQLRHTLGKQAGDVWLVNTSRLVYQKGFDTIIRALTFLPPHIKLVMVGSGGDEGMLRALAAELRVENRVICTGQIHRHEVTTYRQAADIFVAPSRSEGLGNAFVSALASRIPLITSGVGGIADYATDGETAWIVPPDDPRALAAKIEEVIAHPDTAREVSERARALVEREYDWDRIATTMRRDVFEAVLS